MAILILSISFRVYVTDIIDDIQVSVYLCDYGDITVVQQSSLQPLKSEFLELPYQAVKAKLVGEISFPQLYLQYT